jgi:hypothetical protein
MFAIFAARHGGETLGLGESAVGAGKRVPMRQPPEDPTAWGDKTLSVQELIVTGECRTDG